MAKPLSRADLVERLASVSHRTWMRQKVRDGGDSPEQLSERVTDHDRERADDIVQELEELKVYAQRQPSALFAALRHPVIVGALLAVFTGLFASVLVPSLTRVWQDRPRELALKQALVARISREATRAVGGAFDGLSMSERQRQGHYARVRARWRIESAIIGSELTTYFPASRAHREWQSYALSVNDFLLDAIDRDPEDALFLDDTFSSLFRLVRFDNRIHEAARKALVDGRLEMTALRVEALLIVERDEIAADIVESEASGFSHGFWLFR